MAAPRKQTLRVACVQINATANWRRNLQKVHRQIKIALRRGADLIALPENFYRRGPAAGLGRVGGAMPGILRAFQELAARHHAALLLGSMVEPLPHSKKFGNTSVLISESGRVAARYRKIHLFDVSLKDVKVRESRNTVSGSRVVTGSVWGVRTGLTVCYDLRFPELFRRLSLRGCKIIFVPSNFTETTGKAHWEILLRARAIENQVFIVAPAQVGVHPSTKIRSFGTSLVIDPWGEVLARGSRTREEVVMADLNLGFQAALRKSFPVLKHRRLRPS